MICRSWFEGFRQRNKTQCLTTVPLIFRWTQAADFLSLIMRDGTVCVWLSQCIKTCISLWMPWIVPRRHHFLRRAKALFSSSCRFFRTSSLDNSDTFKPSMRLLDRCVWFFFGWGTEGLAMVLAYSKAYGERDEDRESLKTKTKISKTTWDAGTDQLESWNSWISVYWAEK